MLKAAPVKMFILTIGKITMFNVEVAHSEEPTENYLLTLLFPSVLQGASSLVVSVLRTQFCCFESVSLLSSGLFAGGVGCCFQWKISLYTVWDKSLEKQRNYSLHIT